VLLQATSKRQISFSCLVLISTKMMRLGSFCWVGVVLSQQGLATTTAAGFLRNNNNNNIIIIKDAPSIYDCLQAASGGEECRAAFDGQCVWCAEPIYGLCVTPSVANTLKILPFFKCDPHNSTSTSTTTVGVVVVEEEEEDEKKKTNMITAEASL
jgi:hypothetical protein